MESLVMKMVSTAAMLAALLASPAVAQRLDRPWKDATGVHISSARAAALRKCSIRARLIPEHFYEESDLLIYRACMNDHRQVE
jgi:hypothetical protein